MNELKNVCAAFQRYLYQMLRESDSKYDLTVFNLYDLE